MTKFNTCINLITFWRWSFLCEMNRNLHKRTLQPMKHKVTYWSISRLKFSDAGIQDISPSISINVRIQRNLNDLTERYESDDDDQSDKHLEARDRIYTCLKFLDAGIQDVSTSFSIVHDLIIVDTRAYFYDILVTA